MSLRRGKPGGGVLRPPVGLTDWGAWFTGYPAAARNLGSRAGWPRLKQLVGRVNEICLALVVCVWIPYGE